MSNRRHAALRVGLGTIAVAIVLAIARPWTIRPIHMAPAEAFDADAYVASIWPQILETADRSAVDVTTVGRVPPETAGDSLPTRRALFVRGTGVVSMVDLGSRVGLAHLEIDGVVERGVAIQVGPVLRGTAVRDALPFVRFTDFTNQFDFAAVAGSINRRVLQEVLGPIDLETLAGRRVSFTGAAVIDNARADSTLAIVPVILHVGEEPQ
jgi:predicted lipoprotein